MIEGVFIAAVKTPAMLINQFRPISEKWVPVPSIAFAELPDAGGLYFSPQKREELIGNRFISLEKGLLIVDPSDTRNEHALSHEWRHHWQAMNGWVYDGMGWKQETIEGSAYFTQLRSYFRNSRSEMDALLFSHRRTNSICEEWRDALEIRRDA